MTFRDFVEVSTGNLWRMKLRTFLTVSGVVVAIAALVSMLSFGAGNQQLVTKQYEELGLLSTMQVYPKTKPETGDTIPAAVLDDKAIEVLSKLPGVNLAYPFHAVSVRVKLGDSTIDTKAQALPSSAVRTKLFSRILAGTPFDSDSSRQVLATDELAKAFGITRLDSLVGLSIVISTGIASIDSGLAHVLSDTSGSIKERLDRIAFDSLRFREYSRRVIRTEVNNAMSRFTDGFLNAKEQIVDTLTICGVLGTHTAGHSPRSCSIMIPEATARRFTSGFSGDPAELFAAMTSGTLFPADGDTPGRNYPIVTLDLDPHTAHRVVGDSVRARGFRAFSFAEEFDELRRFFFYFDLALGVVGFIALVTASLGIVNTMVMSILERKREIGVLKSLGADEQDIRWLFLAESGMIGAIGSAIGIVFGWLITRAASFIAMMIMENEGIPPMDLFAMPFWLVALALAVGVGVSLAAGLYPASRAARIDPLEALRND
jgi:putative ABC transport system permease protein